MLQPTEVPEFDTNETDSIEPTTDLKTDGFVDGEPVVQSYFNYLFFWIYQWILYLQAQDFAGDLKVAGVYRRTTALKRPIAPQQAFLIDGTLTVSEASIGLTTGTVTHHYLHVTEGERITSVVFKMFAATGTTQTMAVWKKGPSGARAQLGTTQTQVGDDNAHTFTVSGLTETVLGDGTIYYVESLLTTGSVGQIDVGCYFTHDIP